MSAEMFVEQVREYIAFVERAGTLPIEERLATARVRLLALYTAALSLSRDVEPSDAEPPERVARVPARWRGFGNKDFYLEIYDDVASSLRDWDVGRVANALRALHHACSWRASAAIDRG